MMQEEDELQEAQRYWSSFEMFKGKHTKRYRPAISVRKDGRIIFNKSFILQAKIERAKFVSLLYSPALQTIAFDFDDEKPKDMEVFKLAKIGASESNYSISALSFFKFFKLKVVSWTGVYMPAAKLLGENPPDPPVYRWQIKLTDKDHPERER